LLLACTGSGQAQPAQRIVSINLCTDQLLLLLASRERIRSVSFMAANPAYSAYAERVGDIPLNHARIEEIVAYQPDLILAYALSDGPLLHMLRALAYRVEVVDAAESLEAVGDTILSVATLLDERQRGEEIVAAMQRRLRVGRRSRVGRRLRVDSAPPQGARKLAVIYAPNGYSPGARTLQGAVLEAAGFANLSRQLGNDYGAAVPLEQILRHQPDLFIIDDEESNSNSMAQKKLSHPALRKSIARSELAHIAGRYWSCPTPLVSRAVAELREFL
jgi:iron complex transport system substrate-binding protein